MVSVSYSSRSRVALMVICLAGLAVAFAACAKKGNGIFEPSFFRHTKYDYYISYLDVGQKLVLPADWQLDNYYMKGHSLSPKDGPRYVTQIDLDLDGDGTFEHMKSELTYDLRFTHTRDGGVIWLRSVPMSENLRQTELRVLAQDYIDGIAGAGYEVVNIRGAAAVEERRYAAEVKSKRNMTVAGRPAFSVTVDVANIDQIKLTPSSRRERVRVVLIRPGFEYKPSVRTKQSLPVVMIAGYANLPDDFPKHVEEFEGLLSRIVIGGQRGIEQDPLSTGAGSEDAGSAEAEAAAPPANTSVPVPDAAAPADAAPAAESGGDSGAGTVDAAGGTPSP